MRRVKITVIVKFKLNPTTKEIKIHWQ